MVQPRVVLLDDDVMIRRFVEMALETLPIELVCCDTVASALRAIGSATTAVPLVITDLMLRGETGFDLILALDTLPGAQPRPLVAVFSAGLASDVRKQLAQYTVWRLLPKPIGVLALEDCVTDALQAWRQADRPGSPDSLQDVADSPTGAGGPSDGALSAFEQQAVERHFAGDLPLFTGYRAACLAQWPADISEGDAAVQAADAPALRRLGHSLKTVLNMIGRPDLARQAQSLDDAAARADWPAALPLWQQLRQSLCEVVGAGPT